MCMIIPSVSVQFIIGHGKRSISLKKHFPLPWLVIFHNHYSSLHKYQQDLGNWGHILQIHQYPARTIQPLSHSPNPSPFGIRFYCFYIIYIFCTFICDLEINMHSAFTFIDRQVQSDQKVELCPTCRFLAEVKQGSIQNSCLSSHTLNKCPF